MLIGKSMKVYSLFIMFSIMAMGFTSVILIIFFRKKVKAEELEQRKKVLEDYAGSLNIRSISGRKSFRQRRKSFIRW